MPDLGMPPSPPPDVLAQMQPTQPSGPPGGGVGNALGQMGQGFPSADVTPKVLQAEPLLLQLARLVPQLAPDTDRLLGEMKSRMTGMSSGLAGLAGALGIGGPPPSQAPQGFAQPFAPDPNAPPSLSSPGTQMPLGGGGVTPPPMPGGGGMGYGQGLSPAPTAPLGPPPAPPMLPPPPTETGVMDVAMQLEVLLPSIGADDAELLPDIQYFVARMRDEVPKVMNQTGDDQFAALQKNTPPPSDDTLKALPVTA